jgi:hypothetical protein
MFWAMMVYKNGKRNKALYSVLEYSSSTSYRVKNSNTPLFKTASSVYDRIFQVREVDCILTTAQIG